MTDGRSLLPLAGTTARLLRFSLATRGYRGFRDWNIGYERVFEYGETFAHIARERPASVLDVAGDISMFGCFMADALATRVDIVDMGDLAYCEGLRERMRPDAADRVRLIPRTRAEELPAGLRYDAITCISAIEHFDGDADLRFVESAARLLNPGGSLIVTAPFTAGPETVKKYRRQTYYEAHGQDQAEAGFYMRHYSVDDIRGLAEASGLATERLTFGGEVVNFYDRVYQYGSTGDGSRRDAIRDRVAKVVGRLSPLYPFLFMRRSDDPLDFRDAPRRKRIYNPDTFFMALRR